MKFVLHWSSISQHWRCFFVFCCSFFFSLNPLLQFHCSIFIELFVLFYVFICLFNCWKVLLIFRPLTVCWFQSSLLHNAKQKDADSRVSQDDFAFNFEISGVNLVQVCTRKYSSYGWKSYWYRPSHLLICYYVYFLLFPILLSSMKRSRKKIL